jgi:hypothetical protein
VLAFGDVFKERKTRKILKWEFFRERKTREKFEIGSPCSESGICGDAQVALDEVNVAGFRYCVFDWVPQAVRL